MNNIDSLTVQRLCDKSQEAFILSIELYNRPTLKYRVEGCAFFLCNAWELLLKAHLVQRNGNRAIYYSDKADRTLSLEDCVKKVFTNEKDPLRRNLSKVIDLRNTSTHFVVQEYEGIYAPILQACVENYDEKARELMGIEISDRIPENYLVLSVGRSDATIEECRARYSPEVISRMIDARSGVLTSADEEGNRRYAHTYTTELRLTKKKDADLTVRIDKNGNTPVSIIKQLVKPEDKYPYRTNYVVEEIQRRLNANSIQLKRNGCPQEFNSWVFNLFIKMYGMKDDPRFSINTSMKGEQPRYAYSQQTIDDIYELIKQNSDGIIEDLRSKATNK